MMEPLVYAPKDWNNHLNRIAFEARRSTLDDYGVKVLIKAKLNVAMNEYDLTEQQRDELLFVSLREVWSRLS